MSSPYVNDINIADKLLNVKTLNYLPDKLLNVKKNIMYAQKTENSSVPETM